ncbi:helix-turn-helix domain-containing protein [Sphingobium nicotianae]|uniref:helix-turn-helix domain-containing protein n=1 Tax=Sphingobium nicotianae TaxID=2782607 RepID=UPI0020330D6C|nr:helix-turn-helix domain-containing protein [Sphingobium nicotianae]
MWRDIHNAQIASFDYGITGDRPFEAHLDAISFGRITVGTMTGTVNKAERSTANIREDGGDGYCLLINNSVGGMAGTQLGRDFLIDTGAAVLVSNSEAVKLVGSNETAWTSVILTNQLLDHGFTHIGDRLGLEIRQDNEALTLLRAYHQLLVTTGSFSSPALTRHAGETLLDLVALATGLKGKAADLGSAKGLRAARLSAILQKIEQHYREPSFSSGHVAAQLALSSRYVNDLLHETGRSFADRVLELRLQEAFRMLTSERFRAERISDIAYRAGFSDISYFNRSFRARFGCTPKAAR